MEEEHKRYKYLEPTAVAKVRNFNLIARSVVEGFITGLHKSPYHGFSVEFAEHRKYVPGDDPKDLDWQAYGRTDRYYIKQYQEETNLKAYILLDTSASMAYKSEGATMSKLEYGSFIAACLGYLMMRQQDSVGLVMFNEKIDRFIPPGSTTTHLNMMLRQLENAKPGTVTNISKAFHDLAENIKRRGLIIIISDLYDDPKGVIRGLHHFRFKRHEVILFHIFDPAELQFPFQRLSNFQDAETNEELQVDPLYVRQEYLKAIDEFISSYRRDCSSAQIEYRSTDTMEPYDRVLSSFLAARQKL